MLLDALQTYNASASARTDEHKKFVINAQFGVAMSIYHALGLLKNHGMKSCYNFLKNFSEKEVKEKV
jgi:ERCC4-related helicase